MPLAIDLTEVPSNVSRPRLRPLGAAAAVFAPALVLRGETEKNQRDFPRSQRSAFLTQPSPKTSAEEQDGGNQELDAARAAHAQALRCCGCAS